MKKLFAVIASLFLLACSSKGIQPMSVTDEHLEISDNVSSVAESVFQESSGTLKLAFDAKGNWLKITTRGAASLAQDNPAARDSALMIATMRTKRTVAEFLNNDVKSVKTLNRLSKTYAKSFQVAENQDMSTGDDSDDLPSDAPADKRSEESKQAQRFAELLSERIQDSSATIIKGSYVSYHGFEDGHVVVELTVARDSVGAAKQMSRLMSGGNK